MAEDWLVDVRKYAGDADEGVVGAIVKYCGIALQSRDGQLVAMSDKKERETVRENYLKKKLGLVHSDEVLDEAVVAVGERMKADRTKNRVTVYYLLAEHFGLLSLFGGASGAGASGAAAVGAAGIAAAAMGSVEEEKAEVAPIAAAAPIPDPVPAPEPIAVAAVPEAMPETIAEPVPEPVAEPVAAYSNYDGDAAATGGGLGWLKWLLLALLLAALLFFLLRSCSKPDEMAVAEPSATATAPAAPATTQVVPADAATAAAEPVAAAIPQGSGVVAGEIGGRPKLTVYFDTGKSAVSNDLSTAGAKLKDYMAKNPAAKIAVSGYNDPTGNAAANAALSKKRAQEVAKALAGIGIPAASIALEKPPETTGTGTSNAESRRVEVVVKP
jgi:outer membrane protein OmpA-like peptidoglycan-associated protein